MSLEACVVLQQHHQWDFLQSGEWCMLVPSDDLTTSDMLISGR